MNKGYPSISEDVGKETKYKLCPVRFCKNNGVYLLEVKYIHRYGWFCDSCKESLEACGLVNLVIPKTE